MYTKSRLQLLYTVILLFFFKSTAFGIESLSVISGQGNVNNKISAQAISDVISLLKKACNCDVSINNKKAEILLVLPDLDPSKAQNPAKNDKEYPLLKYPEHSYSWSSKRVGSQIELKLNTESFEGISFALYGLLQEQLGFYFYHPKQQVIPEIKNWPLSEKFSWSAIPKFPKKGFHLHTMHPIELTEALLNVNYPNGIQEIKTYIDWLARNQQNYFEFNLLESIDRKKWVNYIKEAVDYAKSRGIIMGIDISLHMTQQKAFMLYKNFPASFLSKEKQISKNIEYLAEAGFDVYSVEFSTTEFTPGNIKKKKKLQLFLGALLDQKGAKLFGREHVVQKDKMLKGKKQKEYVMSADEKSLDQKRALLVHTVMFYNIFEDKAPVYKNSNLKHMLDIYKKESTIRETWYYPESAYWITFDNSVPMTLLPYLKARLDDINLMDSLGAEGHLTFSSGWEWGYWLTDWSIARWSWEHSFNGKIQKNTYMQYFAQISELSHNLKVFNSILDLQQDFIKDKELIRYLSPLTFSDELPSFIKLELQPRPLYNNKYLSKKALPYQLDTLKKNAIEPLLRFADSTEYILNSYKNQNNDIEEELRLGLYITALRARHKANVMSYYIDKREAGIKKQKFTDVNNRLATAAKIREQALELVKKQEKFYRYPNKLLSETYKSKTAYNFGYLYTVNNLHYWKREEEQARKAKYSPFFMNIMDVWKIMGLKN
jgi:hypothetical protein